MFVIVRHIGRVPHDPIETEVRLEIWKECSDGLANDGRPAFPGVQVALERRPAGGEVEVALLVEVFHGRSDGCVSVPDALMLCCWCIVEDSKERWSKIVISVSCDCLQVAACL